MKQVHPKTNIFLASVITAVFVGVVNTASAFVAYNFLIPEESDTGTESFISKDDKQNKSPTASSPQSGPTQAGGTTSTSTSVVATPKTVRKSEDPIKVGEAAKPTQITTDANGQVRYQWCSGVNPNLEDAVCEAIISIASDPSASNPHLGEKAVESLSLLPKNITLTMHESTWASTSATSGTMLVTAHTPSYGDVELRIALEKINGIWIIQDGYLA